MKNYYILFILLILNNANANSKMFNDKVKVVKKSSVLTLEGPECSVLDSEAKILESWSTRVKERTSSQKDCKCSNNVCSKEISAVLPKIVIANQFKAPEVNGPNCWNSSLVAAKIIPNLRYSTPEELTFWLNSPVCKEKQANEALSAGDIISIVDSKGEPVHGFVHLSENLSFSKNGQDTENVYSLQDPKHVFDFYDVKDECQRPSSKGSCKSFAKYYSCIGVDEYKARNKTNDELLIETTKSVNALECSLSKSVFADDSVRYDMNSYLETNIEILKKLIGDVVRSKKYSKDDEILWKGLYHQMNSMDEQRKMNLAVGM